MSDSNMGPACAYGSRATLPVDILARSAILANDCADYLECVGMATGQARAEYLRGAAEDYCQHCDIAPNSIHDSEWNARAVAVIDSVYLYMRRHVFACVQVMRRRNAAYRLASRVAAEVSAYVDSGAINPRDSGAVADDWIYCRMTDAPDSILRYAMNSARAILESRA
jgi:hypothetical protein